MQHVRFGPTGLQVSRLCLGTMTFGPHCDEKVGNAHSGTSSAPAPGASERQDRGRNELALGRIEFPILCLIHYTEIVGPGSDNFLRRRRIS